MKLQTSPDNGLCLLTSFAMVFDMDTRELQGIIDGGNYREVAFPGLPIPYCWRGYHIQQFIRYAVSRGYAVTPIELAPAVAPPLLHRRRYPPVPIYQSTEAATRSYSLFEEIVRTTRGVLTGNLSSPNEIVRGHAVAYERGIVLDPRGRTFNYSLQECESHNLYANCAWRVDKMEDHNES